MNLYLKRAFVVLLLAPVLFSSCATYNKSMNAYYSSIQSQDYDKALAKLDHNKFIQRNRNQLLYFLEAGRVYRLILSNSWFISIRH